MRGKECKDWTLNYKDDHSNLYIYYKQKPLLEITVKRSVSATHHYTYYGNTNDYVYKDFEISYYNDTLEERIEEIEQQLIQAQIRENDKQAKALEALKTLKEIYNADSEWDLRNAIEYIYKNKYSLCEKVF